MPFQHHRMTGLFQRSQHAATQLILIKGFAHIVAFITRGMTVQHRFKVVKRSLHTRRALPTAARTSPRLQDESQRALYLRRETKWAMHTAS